jgi:hypothetical protein
MPLGFEWNPRKAGLNLKKHGMGFAEAASVFTDPLAQIFATKSIPPSNIARLLSITLFQRNSRWSSLPRRGENNEIMKHTPSPVKSRTKSATDLQPEYRFDYGKAKPNRFAGVAQPGAVAVLLDPDVARVFKSGESVNTVLRALLTMPTVKVRAKR